MRSHLLLLSGVLAAATLITGCSKESEPDAVASAAPAEAAPATTTTAAPAATAPQTTALPAPTGDSSLVTQTLIDQHIAASKANIQQFAMALQQELKGAIDTSGPVEAISVCNLKAPKIAAQTSEQSGMNVSRTSLKLRNPNNAPDGWMENAMQQFEQRLASGENATELDYYEITEIEGKPEFRYLKAIPTQSLCLTCHGSEIQPEISARLQELYPADKATGFSEGQLRGAFVVTRAM